MKKLYINELLGLAFYVTLEEECATFSIRGMTNNEEAISKSIVTKRKFLAGDEELIPMSAEYPWPNFLLLKNENGTYAALRNFDYKDKVYRG